MRGVYMYSAVVFSYICVAAYSVKEHIQRFQLGFWSRSTARISDNTERNWNNTKISRVRNCQSYYEP